MSTDQPHYITVDPRFEEFMDTATPPDILSDGHIWTEGPVWLDGALYFNDIPNKCMHVWREGQGASLALPNSEFANGNTTDLTGHMISCEHGGRRVLGRRDPSDLDAVDVIADAHEGRRLNSPNDVVVRSDGTVWFTDPPYGINSDVEGYPAQSEQGGCFVYCVATDGTVHPVAKDFDKPNGLAFAADEKRLYIADSGAILGASFPGINYDLPHHIRVFDVDGTTLKNGRVFAVVAPGVPDGLRVDHEGFVWTSAMDGVHCLSPEGALIGKIKLPAATANLCFGGVDGTTMFITSSDKVYRVCTTRRDASHVLREKLM
ncbi:MAG: SMP-30/gluconolactonase/LRE family protein [Pseudomonadota bacterium]